MRKKGQTVPVGGAYDLLPTVTGNRGLNLQLFVDTYIETGDRKIAYLTAGGTSQSENSIRVTCHDILNLAEVKQAVVERSAQKFFDLAPTSVKVLKSVLEMEHNNDPKILKIQVQVATKVMETIQVEKHTQEKMNVQQQALDAHADMASFMGHLNEFIGKNPEWSGHARGSASVIDADARLLDVESDEPA